MLFNSYVFWVFLAIVLAIHAPLDRVWRNRVLLVASYVFYGFWDWRFLFLIFASTMIDYVVALGLARAVTTGRRKALLAVSVTANLGILGFFKYFDFFVTQLHALLSGLGAHVTLPMLHVILPVGISFYTFQTMSYTIDVYRRQLEPTRRFFDFALFVAFFPQLVAGPIERASRLLPQILRPRRRTTEDFRYGAYQVLYGLFLKVVVADNMAAIADAVFASDPAGLSGWEVAAGVYAFAFQIYGDFAGYSSIARGVARWLGYDLMVNFRMPYLSASPSEFWRRWHISLSTWLRDYLYIPLGGNRAGQRRTYVNLSLTMLLGGLWHGAAWTFVVWGAYQGAILVVYRLFERRGERVEDKAVPRAALPAEGKAVPSAALSAEGNPAPRAAPRSANPGRHGWTWGRVLGVLVMFQLACVGWLFFRAQDLGQVGAMASRLLADTTLTPFATGAFATMAFFVVPLLIYEVWLDARPDVDAVLRSPWLWRAVVYAYFVLMLVFFPAPTRHEFIYFQF